MLIPLKFKAILPLVCMSLASTTACAEESSPLQTVFEAFNKCASTGCATQYLDGFMLKQFEKLSPKAAKKFLRHSVLSSYKAKTKIIGEHGALFISDYKGPETKGGITMVYLFEKQDGLWKIYHRLPEKDVDADLRPITQ